jgi:mannitol/fructose-specific phosphotransferase system IIA component (Ntr-type)
LPEREILQYQLDDTELTELMTHKVILQFQSMGFFINKLDPEVKHYSLSRNDTSISLIQEPHGFALDTERENSIFAQRMVHEAAFYLKQTVSGILSMDDLHAPWEELESDTHAKSELEQLLKVDNIIPELKFETKEGVIWELVESLFQSKRIPQIKSIYYAVMEREKFLSGGLVHGLAIPHLHTNEVTEPLVAVGIKHKGIDFSSIDKKPSYVIFLILTPESASSTHIRLLANISRLGRQPQKIMEIIKQKDPEIIRQQIISAITPSDEF